MKRRRIDPDSAFLNIPYDNGFKDLYLAFLAGLSSFGLLPRATLEIPGGERRLDRVFDLLTTCRYLFHDLSRVELDRSHPPTPRFNMPFELGLALAWQKVNRKGSHIWFVFEAVRHRLHKSLSDLDGTDPYIHGGTVSGVFRELNNALVRSRHRPTLKQMRAIYSAIRKDCPKIIAEAGSESLFEPRVFKELVVLARAYAPRYILSLRR